MIQNCSIMSALKSLFNKYDQVHLLYNFTFNKKKKERKGVEFSVNSSQTFYFIWYPLATASNIFSLKKTAIICTDMHTSDTFLLILPATQKKTLKPCASKSKVHNF